MEEPVENLLTRIYEAQYSHNVIIPGPFGDRYLTYSDYIASGQPLTFVESFLAESVLPTYANTHTEASFTGRQTSRFREEARDIIKRSVNASDDDLLLFTGSGCTGAIDLLVRKLIQFYQPQQIRPVVFIGPFEHHSNILPWREGPFDLVEVPICKDGNVDLHFLEEKLRENFGKKPMIGSFSAASNVTGILTPVDAIVTLLKKFNALSFWDYAGAAPYVKIDMNPAPGMEKDALFISPHKLVGGPGTPGILLAKKSLFDRGLPVVTGGGTVHFVTKTQQRYFEDLETREEGGTPAIIESIRAGLVFKLKDEVGASRIEAIEKTYITTALSRFSAYRNIYVLGNLNAPRLGFLAFHIRYKERFLHHNFVVALLNDLFGIQSRGGCSCAGPYGHDLLSLSEEKSQQYMVELAKGNVGSKPGWVRLNFNYFIPQEEFDFIVAAITWISEHGWKLLNTYHFDDDTSLWIAKNATPTETLSLNSFLTHQSAQLKGSTSSKIEDRKRYFSSADSLAQTALLNWNDLPIQSYRHDQVQNPLRWYALANDVSSDEGL